MLTDVVMPGMNGRELVERFRRRWPLVHVLYMSGDKGDVVIRYGVETAADAFLQKPFTPPALARKIRQTLDRRGWTNEETNDRQACKYYPGCFLARQPADRARTRYAEAQ
ncbi:MAG: response regulator [Planctomycetales bacterium]|nr:response regulator [Planctomycetales bacterium]